MGLQLGLAHDKCDGFLKYQVRPMYACPVAALVHGKATDNPLCPHLLHGVHPLLLSGAITPEHTKGTSVAACSIVPYCLGVGPTSHPSRTANGLLLRELRVPMDMLGPRGTRH